VHSSTHSVLLFVLPLCLIVSIFPFCGYSQNRLTTPIIAYNHTLNAENGLSENNISCVIKDSDGFMWMGTGDGLNKFDGYSFIHYSHSDNDSSSLSHSAIQNMIRDSKGRLWIGTYNGLNLYDGKNETFRKFLVDHSNNAANSNTSLYLLEDSRHQLWMASYGEIYKIDIETFNVTTYDHEDDSTGLRAVSALFEDRKGKIWAANNKGICILDSLGSVERTIYHNNAAGGLPSDNIIDIVQDGTGAIYFATNGNGVLRLDDENDQTFERFTSVPGRPFFGTNIIGSLAVDKDGKLLVGTDGAGIYKQDNIGTFRQILGSQSRHLHNGNIVTIFVDEQNVYWLGLYGRGVQVVYASNKRFEHYRYFDLDMERIGKNSVLAIAEDQHHKIWIGTDGAGLYKFDPESKLFTSYRHSPTNKNSLGSDVVKSLLVDEKNNLYAGTFGGGLNYLNTKTESFSHYTHVPDNNTSISSNHVWSLLQDRNQKIYVGQLSGLDEFFPDRKVFKPLRVIGPRKPAIYCMEEDNAGNIWVGSRLDGIHRYDPKRKTFTSFKNIPEDSASMPTNEIVDLNVNFQGKLWVGTGNKGLILLDPNKLTFKKNAVGVQDKNISNVIEDDAHNVWFTSVDGVHKFEPSTLKIYSYSIADGLQGTQFNEGTRLKSADGTYYLGGTNGLNVFRPENITDDTVKARVVFTKLSLFNKPVTPNDKSGLLTESVSRTESITLRADDNVFSLEFACLEFNFPKKNRYRYYLDGFDKEWNDANESRTATYTNLPPGDYTLKISASNARGQWNEEAAKIRIIIIPRWYERVETKLAAAIFLIVLTVLIIHFRTKLLFKQKLKLEQLVKARTNLVETQKLEIKDKNTKLEQAYEEVNSTNEELQRVNSNLEKLVEDRTAELTLTIKKLTETDKGLDTFLYRSSHDLRGPIATILGLAHLGKMEHDPAELNLYFANIERTSTRMLRLLRKLDETSSLFRAQRALEVINVDDMIRNVETAIADLNADSIVKIEFENKIGRTFIGDAALLTSIVTNLMENSIVFRNERHSYAKCVLSIENKELIISVIDNGTGIPSSAIDRITNMFYRGSEKSIGNGLGLFMVKKALEVLHGKMEIDSEPNVMTTFTIKIPYEQK